MTLKDLTNRCQIFLVGLAGSLLLRIVNRTLRWETVGLDGENRHWPHKEPRIVAFWHGQQLMMPWIYLNQRKDRHCRNFLALISQHSDGRMVARAMQFLGIGSIAGSSSRRGREALFTMIEKLKNGSHIAITPDGPKGPPCKLKGGVIRVAERSGASIYPAAIAAERSWTFGSWDGMALPKPFSRAVLMMGDAIAIPEGLSADDVQRYTALVEDALNALSLRAKNYKYGAS